MLGVYVNSEGCWVACRLTACCCMEGRTCESTEAWIQNFSNCQSISSLGRIATGPQELPWGPFYISFRVFGLTAGLAVIIVGEEREKVLMRLV